MVKSKKMSKTSIAIIVLALLLVLSMVLGLTGAWFTNTANDQTSGATIGFGEIAIAVNGTAGSAESGCVLTDILPGCQVNVGEAVIVNAANNEEAYVLYKTELEIYYVDGSEVEHDLKGLVTAADGNTNWFTYSVPAYGWVKIAGGKQFSLASFDLVLHNGVENVAYDKTGQIRYILNDSALTGAKPSGWNDDVSLVSEDVVIKVTITAYAIQADHVAYTDLNTFAAGKVANYTDLTSSTFAEIPAASEDIA